MTRQSTVPQDSESKELSPQQAPSQRRFRDYLKKVTLALCTFVLMLVIAEVALRIAGAETGYNDRIKNVDKLEVYDSYLTDNEGIFKANPSYDWPEDVSVNDDGFRSVHFAESDTTQTKILFLGDSFTWGASADPITESFVDIIGRNGYMVYNTGIPGTGPGQYLKLAEKYIPQLKPDVVALMFCMANDFEKDPPQLQPHQNLYHATNAGMFSAFDRNGRYMSAHEAYEHYTRLRTDLGYALSHTSSLSGKLRTILFKSVLGTYCWFGSKRLFAGASSGRKIREQRARNCLERIREVAAENGGRFLLFLIPEHPKNVVTSHLYGKLPRSFEGFDARVPDNMTLQDFAKLPNNHFNTAGHRKYASFILQSLDFEGIDAQSNKAD